MISFPFFASTSTFSYSSASTSTSTSTCTLRQVERIQALVKGKEKPDRMVNTPVYEYA